MCGCCISVWPRITLGTERKGAARQTDRRAPFSNFSSDPQADYLGDALTDELIHSLTRVPNLRVVARTSTFQFKGKSADLGISAHSFRRLVLEEAYRRTATGCESLAQLIDAATGASLVRRFDRQFDDVSRFRTRFARRCRGPERAAFRTGGSWRGAQKAVSLEVYTLYLRGLREWNRRDAGV